jgi:hypothetical protein
MGAHQEKAIEAVRAERLRQDAKWGGNGLANIPVLATIPFCGTPFRPKDYGIPSAKVARAREQRLRRDNNESGLAALVEEVAELNEAALEDFGLAVNGAQFGIDEERSEQEAIQVAALAIKMLEGIYERRERRAARAERKNT